MTKIAFLFALIFYCHQSSGQEWTNTSLNDRVKMDFPTLPDTEVIGNIRVFQIVGSDYVISISVNDMSQNTEAVKPDELVGIYQRIIKGVLDAATNSKLLDEKKVEIDGFEGREITYTKDFNGVIGMRVTKRILLLDKTLFTFDVWDLEGTGQENLIEKLFQSISVT